MKRMGRPRGALVLAGMLAVFVGLPGIAVARDRGMAGAPLDDSELCALLAEVDRGVRLETAEPADIDLVDEILNGLEDAVETVGEDVLEELFESLRGAVAVLDRARFDTVGPFPVGTTPVSVAVGDFDDDDRPDLAVANFGSDAVHVLVNSTASGGTVGFATAAVVGVGAGDDPSSVAVDDLNGDDLPDIAVAEKTAGTVSVLRNTTIPGIMNFVVAGPFGVGASPSSVALADFDPESKPDLAVANDVGAVNDTVTARRNTTPNPPPTVAPTFAAAAIPAPSVGTNPSSVAVGDFNDDSKPDLAVANRGDGTVSVLVNTTTIPVPAGGNFSFGTGPTPAVGLSPSSVAVGDFNDDGKPDLVVTNDAVVPDNTVSVLLNTTAGGSITFGTRVPFTVGDNPSSVAVGDFNGDDRLDLAVANRGSDNVSVLLGDGQGVFGPAANFTVGDQPASVAVEDLSGDDLPDLAVVNSMDDNVSVLVNTTATPDDDSTSTVAAPPGFAVSPRLACHPPASRS